MRIAAETDVHWEAIDAYRAELIQQAQAITGNREDAEDAVQETLLSVSKTPKIPPFELLGGWLRSVNRYNALMRVRSRSRESRRTRARQERLPEETFTTGGFSRLELRDWLEKGIHTLPPELQTVVRLRYWEQLSYKEMSERLKLPLGTVGKLLLDASTLLFARLNGKVRLGQPGEGKIHEGETQQAAPIDGSQA